MRFLLCILLASRVIAGDLGLCYDRQRWDETAALARLGGTAVFNIDDGRGDVAKERSAWDAFMKRCRAVGGTVLGYVDLLDSSGSRKADSDIIAEVAAWIAAGYNGVWLDDARDKKADGNLVKRLIAAHPKTIIIANPGTRCSGPLRVSGAWLCEHEGTGSIYWGSSVIIAFVDTLTQAADVRATAKRKGTHLIAVESRSTYHVSGVEYQRKNKFAIK